MRKDQETVTVVLSIYASNRKTPLLAFSAAKETGSIRSWNSAHLVSIHRHTVRIPAQLPLRRGANGSTARVPSRAALLQGHELLGAEDLVVDLRGRLDEILEVRAGEEVAEVDEFAVVLVLDVDDAPSVLTAADLSASDDDGFLGAYDGEGDHVLGLELALLGWR